jgi:hypothetical protein
MLGVNALTNTIEIVMEGTLYRCYRVQTSKDDVERYIVAGVGSITVERATGVIVDLTPVIHDGARVLTKLAPLIQRVSSAQTSVPLGTSSTVTPK